MEASEEDGPTRAPSGFQTARSIRFSLRRSQLTKDQRSNLIEDLNEEGFPDRKNLSATDLPLIENRLALIEQPASSSADEANAAAFKEAYKDLVNMRDRVSIPPSPSK